MVEPTTTPAARRRGAPIRHPELHDPAWLQDAVDRGLTRTDIAHEIGSSQSRVTEAFARHGINAPRGDHPNRIPQLHDAAWLQNAVDRGLTRTDIAREIGSTPRTVSKALSRHRIPAGRPGRPAVHPQLHDPAWLQDAVDQGLTQNAIAATVGCHQSAVSRALHRHNIRSADRPASPPSGDVPDGGAPVGDEAW